MDTGKLPADILKRLLAKTRTGGSVLIGPAYGEDAAAVEFGGKVLVAAADPITFTTDRIGYYAVSVNANDIAVLGGIPKYFLATILLPEGAAESEAESVFDQIGSACRAIDVALIGGHTEITPSVTHTVVSGCMLGEADPSSLIRTSGARVGDAIVLVGGIAIEGTSILAREARAELTAKGISSDIIDRAKHLLDDPGICILGYARTAMACGGVTAMHDPTEGGLAAALKELATASGNGLAISRAAIPVLPETVAICQALDLDPLGLIASGSLLVTASQDAANRIVAAVGESGAAAAVIGHIPPEAEGLKFQDGTDLPVFDRDEIARYFDRRSAW